MIQLLTSTQQINGFVQDSSNSSELAIELLQSCILLSINIYSSLFCPVNTSLILYGKWSFYMK